MKILVSVALLLIFCGTFLGCISPDTNNALNPSNRLVNTQILAIDSALGLRGGLAALTRTSTVPTIPEGMLHGSSLGTSSLQKEEVKLNWALISRRVSTIENAWEDIRSELDLRSSELSESWAEGYIEYYRIMAVKHDFDTSLGAVKLDVSEKNEERIELSVALLTEAFIAAKDVLGTPVVDHRRLILVSSGLMMLLVGITVATSLIVRRRDRRFIKQPTPDKTNMASGE